MRWRAVFMGWPVRAARGALDGPAKFTVARADDQLAGWRLIAFMCALHMENSPIPPIPAPRP